MIKPLKPKKMSSGFYRLYNERGNMTWEFMTVERLLTGIKKKCGYDDLMEEVKQNGAPMKYWVAINGFGGTSLDDGASIYRTKRELLGMIEWTIEQEEDELS